MYWFVLKMMATTKEYFSFGWECHGNLKIAKKETFIKSCQIKFDQEKFIAVGRAGNVRMYVGLSAGRKRGQSIQSRAFPNTKDYAPLAKTKITRRHSARVRKKNKTKTENS